MTGSPTTPSQHHPKGLPPSTVKWTLKSPPRTAPSEDNKAFVLAFLKKTSEFVGQPTMEGFVLKYGSEMPHKPLPKGIPKGRPKFCFKNAFDICNDNPERYVYCEGYGYGAVIPIQHAWALDIEDGKVVDNTWAGGRANPSPGVFYIGVPIKMSYVRRVLLEKKTYGVLDYWEQRWPLVRGAVPENEWKEVLP